MGKVCAWSVKRFCEPPPPPRPSPALGRRGGGKSASGLPFQTACVGCVQQARTRLAGCLPPILSGHLQTACAAEPNILWWVFQAAFAC